MNQAEQQSRANLAEQLRKTAAQHAAKQKHQPAIIEVTHTEGDNEISFAIRGSSQWLNDNLTLVTLTLTTMVKPMMDRADETQRAELLAGINALGEMESFQGDFVRVCIAKEANNEPDEISA